MTTVWKPHVTVAAVLERDGRFLLVEEQTDDGILLNQPAGHLEADESIVQGAVRETLEESAYRFEPDAVIGVYRWAHPGRDIVYLRFAFTGPIVGHEPDRGHALAEETQPGHGEHDGDGERDQYERADRRRPQRPPGSRDR